MRVSLPVALFSTLLLTFQAIHATGSDTPDPTTNMACAEETITEGPWALKPETRSRDELPTIAVIGGTGRMGVHLCAAWAHAGYDVTLCSRSKERAQAIVDELNSGRGYTQAVEGKNAGQGGYSVPPTDATGWKLHAAANADACEADLIVLSTVYEQTASIITELAPSIRGKGKTILDMTNPFMGRPDGYGRGLPKDAPQAGILIHKALLDDSTTNWVGAYKHILWTLILPNGPKNPGRPDVEVFGDETAVKLVVELVYRHGWRPIVRGGLEVAPDHEGGKVSFGKIWGNLKREFGRGEKLSVGW